mgnify:CR=1 FL=1
METFILKKSNRKNKRFVIIMDKMKHHFGSDVGRTYIDGRTEKEKQVWIYYSRHLLWGKHTDLKKNIKDLEKLLNVKIKVEL